MAADVVERTDSAYEVLLTIREINGYDSTGPYPVVFTVPVYDFFPLNFESNATMTSSGISTHNSDWVITEEFGGAGIFHTFKYVGNSDVFAANGTSKVVLSFGIPDTTGSGSQTLNVGIISGAGGDSDSSNNDNNNVRFRF